MTSSDRHGAFASREPETIDDTTELYLLEEHTHKGGWVTAEITGWQRDGEEVIVSFALPTGKRTETTYPWPTPKTFDENSFIRLVRSLGYSAASIDYIVGERVLAREHSKSWTLIPPQDTDYERTQPLGAAWLVPLFGSLSIVERPIDLAMIGICAIFLAIMLPGFAAVAFGPVSLLVSISSTIALFSFVFGILCIGTASLYARPD